MGKKQRERRDSAPTKSDEVQADNCHSPKGCIVKGVKLTAAAADDGEITVRTVCSNDKCTQPNCMHKQCFEIWETEMFDVCKRSQSTRNWGDHWIMNQLWCDKRGYPLIYKACGCQCGGNLKKDLVFYQMQKAHKEPAKKITQKRAQAQQNAAVTQTAIKGQVQVKKLYKMKFPVFTPGQIKTAFSYGDIDSEITDDHISSRPNLPVGLPYTILQKQAKRKKKQMINSWNKGDCNEYATPIVFPSLLPESAEQNIGQVMNASNSSFYTRNYSPDPCMTIENSGEYMDSLLLEMNHVTGVEASFAPKNKFINLGNANVLQYKKTQHAFSNILANIFLDA